jgi:hypothetical protein
MRSRVADFQERTAPSVQQKDEDWYRKQLEPKCPDMMVRGKDFLIRCPFHADNNPSCGVDRLTGVFKCFSCGAGGGWNKLAKQLEMERLGWKGDGKKRDFKAGAMKDDLTRALTKAGVVDPSRQKVEKVRPLVEPWPEYVEWRGLDGSFLSRLGCIKVVDLKHNVMRIGLPVRTTDEEILGYTCRAVDPADAEPKYTPLAADRITWRAKELPANVSLFLVDRAMEEDWDSVVLVEGPFDALKLYAAGIPALAILGTNNWTPQKAAIILGLGLSTVFVMMDNDKSGWEAQSRIVKELGSSIKTVGLRLPDGLKDPGGMSAKQTAWLKAKVGA